jgi:hypothetical protein
VALKHRYTARPLPRYINILTSRFPTSMHAQMADRPTGKELEGERQRTGGSDRVRSAGRKLWKDERAAGENRWIGHTEAKLCFCGV